MTLSTPVCIFLSRGEYDAMHHGFSTAAAAVSMGRPVELYFFWWALERLVRGQLDDPDLERDDVNTTMELRGIPTLRQLLDVTRDSGRCKLFACSGSLQAIGLTSEQVEPHVDALIGWTAILKRTESVVDRFFT